MARKSLSCDMLAKVYRKRRVVDGVSLHVDRAIGAHGQRFAQRTFLGPGPDPRAPDSYLP